MASNWIRGPDLAGVVADANAVGLKYVVIGGFAKVLTADAVAGAHHLRVDSRHGVIDIMRGGLPPLDYETVSAGAEEGTWRESQFRVAALRSVVGFKRLDNEADATV